MKNNITQHPLYERLLSEFHPTKNGELKLLDFSSGSEKKVWWKCNKENDHEWYSTVKDRFNKKESKCPCCAGQKAVLSNCLATLNPELSKQWHPTKNGNLTPFNVTIGSSKKVWWKCDNADDHQWESRIADRIKSPGCACCRGLKIVNSNCMATTHPELSKEWHPIKNGLMSPLNVISGSRKKAYWICKNGHEWKAIIKNRTHNSGCPICKESRGEKAISIILDKMSILYEREKKFDNCKNVKKLPFDFYLPNNNILIEHDGIQHYVPSEYFGGDKSFKDLKLNDSIKTKFAKENNIPLLRIPYTEFNNIERLIIDFISNNKSPTSI